VLTGDRLQHSLAVGRQASRLATAVTDPTDRAAVITAALLHDIGYSPIIASTGWHPLDGARWLHQHGWPPTICRLVMWHTASWHEGRIRGLYDTAAHEYGPPHPTDPLAAIIAAADLTTGPTGQPTTINRRLVEIRNRYPTDSLVVQALELAEADTRRLHTRGNHPPNPRHPRSATASPPAAEPTELPTRPLPMLSPLRSSPTSPPQGHRPDHPFPTSSPDATARRR